MLQTYGPLEVLTTAEEASGAQEIDLGATFQHLYMPLMNMNAGKVTIYSRTNHHNVLDPPTDILVEIVKLLITPSQ